MSRTPAAGASVAAPWLTLALAAAVYASLALPPWHADDGVRRAAGLVAAALLLWIRELAPPGLIALGIPVMVAWTGLMSWRDALAPWGNPIIFLFLGSLLLARALEKHGVFSRLADRLQPRDRDRTPATAGRVILLSGVLSALQNNTAVAAMLLPPVLQLARRSGAPAALLLALSYGATFGGMATPVGTAPNFLGYTHLQTLDPSLTFLRWLVVGIPVWVGVSILGLAVLWLTGQLRASGETSAALDSARAADVAAPHPATHPPPTDTQRRGAAWALGAAGLVAAAWLGVALIKGFAADSALAAAASRVVPESLAPLAAAWLLFLVRIDAHGTTVLDRRDFQAIDWDTLFLIAGGLCLGAALESSGAAAELARAVVALEAPQVLLLLALGGVTVLLSELTSNTATAALMLPLAVQLAPAGGLDPVQAVWLVTLSASLGFALPISTPPNAIVYGTGLVPLWRMALCGAVLDFLALLWVVACVSWLA